MTVAMPSCASAVSSSVPCTTQERRTDRAVCPGRPAAASSLAAMPERAEGLRNPPSLLRKRPRHPVSPRSTCAADISALNAQVVVAPAAERLGWRLFRKDEHSGLARGAAPLSRDGLFWGQRVRVHPQVDQGEDVFSHLHPREVLRVEEREHADEQVMVIEGRGEYHFVCEGE